MKNHTVFRQGDTTNVAIELSESLGECKLKVGIYTPYGKPLYETYWPDEADITQVDDRHFLLEISHDVTRKFKGETTLRAVLYTQDRKLVNAGETAIFLKWEPEPSTENIQY